MLAPANVVAPVPPLAIGKVPVTPVDNGKPVAFVNVADVGVPKTGVTKVGLLDNTTEPVPVLVVTPVPPLATGSVPVTPVDNGKPVALVSVADVGVPKAGVTKEGLLDNTVEPVPVLVVTPVPPLATGKTPVTPVVKGKPVALDSVADAGVPRTGVTSVGLVDNTTLPEPVLVVTPVPPLATAKVPAKVIVPAAVMGPPEVVKPVVPPDTATLVTVPEPPAAIHSASVAPTLTAKTLPALPV